jgi:hypothetical protein
MKRHGNLWDEITSLKNIAKAHKLARRGKSFYSEVKMVDSNPDVFFIDIQHILVSKQFTTSAYEIEQRFDGKKVRTIYKLPYYPDRIVQHALLNVIGPIITKSFIRDTFQSIVGRGTSDAMRRVRKLVIEKTPRFALKVDIEKYYPSINNEIMKAEIRKKFKCVDTLWLIDDIIDSTKGLPIGNYTSQHFGNLYLNEFDWWMKQQIKPDGYFRYCDDMVFMSDSKMYLMNLCKKIVLKLSSINLKIKPTWCIYDVARQGANFVGFVFSHKLTKIRKSIAVKFKIACKQVKESTVFTRSKIMAYKGWCRPVNAKMLWRRNTQRLGHLFPKQLRCAI